MNAAIVLGQKVVDVGDVVRQPVLVLCVGCAFIFKSVVGGETALINAQADAIAAKIEVLINSYTLLSLMGGLSIESIEFVE